MNTKKCKVVFEFLNARGAWMPDELSNNGKGFTARQAQEVATMIRTNSIETRNVRIEEV